MFSRYPRVPWVVYSGNDLVGYTVQDTRTGQSARVRTMAEVTAFAVARSSTSGRGLGDMVKRLTTAIGIKTECRPCQQRQIALNRLAPNIPPLRRRGR